MKRWRWWRLVVVLLAIALLPGVVGARQETPVAGSDLVVEPEAVDLGEGSRVLGLSPDGRWLAALVDESMYVYTVEPFAEHRSAVHASPTC